MGQYFSLAYYFPNKNEEVKGKEKGEQIEEIEEIEEVVKKPISAELLLARDEETMKRLCSALQHRRFVVIRLSDEDEQQIITTRHLVEQFFSQPFDEKLKYELPPSSDPLLPRKRNRGYLPQDHKEYLKIRLVDRDEGLYPSYPPSLKDNFKTSTKRLSEICFAALIALSSANFANKSPTDSAISLDELSLSTPSPDFDHLRWLPLSSLSLCSQWEKEGSSLSVIHYLKDGSVNQASHLHEHYDHNHHSYVDTNANEVADDDNDDDEKRKVCGEHYDTGVMTLIRLSDVAGLEVFDEIGKGWIEVEKEGKEGDMVLILGRKIELLTHNKANLHPTFHRVQLPPNSHRYSILFFSDLPSGKDD